MQSKNHQTRPHPRRGSGSIGRRGWVGGDDFLEKIKQTKKIYK